MYLTDLCVFPVSVSPVPLYVYMFVFCFLWFHVTLSYLYLSYAVFINLVLHCVWQPFFFCCSFILIFAAWMSAYRYLQAKKKTCPDFSLYTNKFFCVENHRIVCFWFLVSIIPVPCLPSVYPVLWAINHSHHHFSTVITFWLCCHLSCPSLCSGSLYNAHNLQRNSECRRKVISLYFPLMPFEL